MITKKQYIILSYFLTRSLFFGLGITKIFHLSYNDAWLSGLVGTLLGLIVISFLYFIRKKKLNIENSFFLKILLFF